MRGTQQDEARSGWCDESADTRDKVVEVDRVGGVDFENGRESEGRGVFSESFDGHLVENMCGVMALLRGPFGEAAGGFLKRKAAENFDGPSVGQSEESRDLFALVPALGAEVRFENESGTVRGEGPEQFHGGIADAAGGFEVAGNARERGEEGFLDVVLGEQGEAEARSKRTREGGFPGGRRAGDENDAALEGCGHPVY